MCVCVCARMFTRVIVDFSIFNHFALCKYLFPFVLLHLYFLATFSRCFYHFIIVFVLLRSILCVFVGFFFVLYFVVVVTISFSIHCIFHQSIVFEKRKCWQFIQISVFCFVSVSSVSFHFVLFRYFIDFSSSSCELCYVDHFCSGSLYCDGLMRNLK